MVSPAAKIEGHTDQMNERAEGHVEPSYYGGSTGGEAAGGTTGESSLTGCLERSKKESSGENS